MDEAHNSRTDASFKALRRLNPAAVIELTATPVEGSNVLYHLSAQALKAEDMIKLPIVLAEHPTDWKDAVKEGENIDKDEIRVATGTQKELDGLDLFDKAANDDSREKMQIGHQWVKSSGIQFTGK